MMNGQFGRLMIGIKISKAQWQEWVGCRRMRLPIADVDFDAVMTGNSRPSAAGRDWPLYGKQIGLSVCQNPPFKIDA